MVYVKFLYKAYIFFLGNSEAVSQSCSICPEYKYPSLKFWSQPSPDQSQSRFVLWGLKPGANPCMNQFFQRQTSSYWVLLLRSVHLINPMVSSSFLKLSFKHGGWSIRTGIKKPSLWLKDTVEIAEDNKRISSVLPFTNQATLAVHTAVTDSGEWKLFHASITTRTPSCFRCKLSSRERPGHELPRCRTQPLGFICRSREGLTQGSNLALYLCIPLGWFFLSPPRRSSKLSAWRADRQFFGVIPLRKVWQRLVGEGIDFSLRPKPELFNRH